MVVVIVELNVDVLKKGDCYVVMCVEVSWVVVVLKERVFKVLRELFGWKIRMGIW